MSCRSSTKWIVIGVISAAALLLLCFSRPLYLSDAYIAAKIESRLSSALGKQVKIESGQFRLLYGAQLRGITLLDQAGEKFLTADSLNIRYRLLPLIRRRVSIVSFSLIRPEIYHRPPKRPPSVVGAAEDLEHQLPRSQKSDQLTFQFDLPVDISADIIEIKDASFHFKTESEKGEITSSLRGINLAFENLYIADSEDFRADVRLLLTDSVSFALRTEVGPLCCVSVG